VKLPDGITCSNCVIHWKYFAGNTWDICPDGVGSVGCGNQETFINCADVTINTNTGGFPIDFDNSIDNPWALYMSRSTRIPGHPPLPIDLEQPARPGGLIPLVVRSQLCLPIGDYRNVTGMEDWCRENCLKYPPNCHPEACLCVNECKAIGEFAVNHQDADYFCHQNCLKYPSHCPQDKCECFQTF